MYNIVGQYQILLIQFIYLQHCMAVSGSYRNVVDEIERERERQMEKKRGIGREIQTDRQTDIETQRFVPKTGRYSQCALLLVFNIIVDIS